MTSREKEVCQAVRDLGGKAHPTAIGKRMGVSGGYAEQLCRDLVWHHALVKEGIAFRLARR